jgi:hypothetical protein
MYLQKVKQKNFFFKLVFCWRLEGQLRKQPDPDPNQLVRGTEACIRGSGSTKMSWIRNTGFLDSDPDPVDSE